MFVMWFMAKFLSPLAQAVFWSRVMPAALLFWSNPLWKFLNDTHRVTKWGPANHWTLALLWPPSLNPLPSPACMRLVPLPHVQQFERTTVLVVCHKSHPSSAFSQERHPIKVL